MIKGIDVSKWNCKYAIDFNKVKASGYEFVYVKHSQGVDSIDNKFVENFTNAKKAGLKVGLYHFASLNDPNEKEDAKKEAEFFLKTTKDIKVDLLPVIDVETNEVNLNKSEVEQWIETYCEILNWKCVLYSSAGFLNSYLNPTHRLGRLPLWLSGYPLDRNNNYVLDSTFEKLKLPKPPIGWNDWIMWQWTAKGSVNGISGQVDLNVVKTLPLI